ncbi:DUF2529 domain-containing protein [bacterium LRH843]|nr:DUF2529 domain-containing protein [bacterium LRH843]
MIKVFTTQFIGLMKGFQEREDFHLEDAARLLSQALVGNGKIYVFGNGEMDAVCAEALYGAERLPNVFPLYQQNKMADLSKTDRVLLIARSTADKETLTYAKEIADKQIPLVIISSIDNENLGLADIADVHLNLNVVNSLVPTDEGTRIGYPASLLALYAYFCLYLLITEILAEI